MRLITLVILLFFASTSIANSASNFDSREDREIAMAESAILTSLMIVSNPASQYLCSKNAYVCLGPDKSDLGLALIAGKNSMQSGKALANIMRYKLDGALSEDFSCYVLGKGKSMKAYLLKLNPEEMEKNCNIEVLRILKKHQDLFDRSILQEVCSDQNEIKERVRDLLVAIRKSTKCDPEDF